LCLLSFFLIRSAAIDPDIALASGCAGVAAERLSDSDFNPTSVLRLIEALADTLASPPPVVNASVAHAGPSGKEEVASGSTAAEGRESKDDDASSEAAAAALRGSSLLVCLLPSLPAVADLLCRAENSATVLGEAAAALAAVLLPLDAGRGGDAGLKAAKSLEVCGSRLKVYFCIESGAIVLRIFLFTGMRVFHLQVDIELAKALVQSMLSAPEANARIAAANLLDRALACEEEKKTSVTPVASNAMSSSTVVRPPSGVMQPEDIAATPQRSDEDGRPIRDLIRASGPAIHAARLELTERDFAAGSDFFNSGDEALPVRVQHEVDAACLRSGSQ